MNKKKVFLTGATGHMGLATVKEFVQHTDRFELTVLVRPTRKNKQIITPYADKIRIIWGDLRDYDDVLRCVTGKDYVLHVGGMVSPKADPYPKKTHQINVGAATNIVRAVRVQPNSDDIKVVYIGTIAETGDRNEPVHWGRTGDPLFISVYDHYAISKVEAERIFAEAGLKHWVSLRQSGILYPSILKNYDPIMFHVPIRGMLEWATVEDSGKLMLNVCQDWVPEDFWNKFYNISSGASYRLTNYEFECKILKTVGCPPPEKIFNANWFVLHNFHGHWYTDADKLEDYLHFRANIPCDEYFKNMAKQLPWYFKLTRLIPAFIFKLAMLPMAYKKGMGTMDWIKTHNEVRIRAYFGSEEAWRAIPEWKDIDTSRPDETPRYLNHGYDESKAESDLELEDMRGAAEYRGGKCLSETMTRGDLFTPLEWQCQFGHKFKASPNLVLKGGHWCPQCSPMPWNYGNIARGNKFFAQVWYPSHPKDEVEGYDSHIFDGFKD